MMAQRPQTVVAGGAGFLGSHVCERLLADGYSVICIDNLSTGIPANVAHLAEQGPFQFVNGDISDRIHIDGEVDMVLNFACPASPPDYLKLPVQTLKVGSIGTLNTLELAREKNARYLLASTSEVYGDPEVHPQPETYWGNVNPIGPRSVYDEAKRFSESLTMTYRRHYATDTAIMRIFNTYGPRMRPTDGRAVPTFVCQALRGEPITVTGDGRQTRSLMYVDDLVEGCMRLLHSDNSGPVNIGNPSELTMDDLARVIRQLTGSTSEIVYIERPTDDPMVRRPDIALAREVLGWEPTVSLEAGLRETIAWLRDAVPAGVPAPPREPPAPASRSISATASGNLQRIAVIGSGYVGLTTGACLASLGHRVVCADVDSGKVERLARGEVDIYEPGLRELVSAGLACGRLKFVLGGAAAVSGANMVFLCVPTPMGTDGAADLSIVEGVAAECRQMLPADCVVVNKSTVPVGTAERMKWLFGREDITVVSNPEFLREGSAVQDFLHPDRIVIGCDREDAARRVADLYAGVDAPILLTDAKSAELIKYAANCFLAMRFSYINVLDELCERLDANIADVAKGMGYDHRIGQVSLSPGPGWGGSCLPKDTHEMLRLATDAGVPFALLRSAIDTNQWRQRQVVDKVRLAVTGQRAGSLHGRRIGLLGLTFKAGTDDLRDSPALAVAALLDQAGAELLGYDPMVPEGTPGLGAVSATADPYAVAEDTDAVVLLTDWPQFQNLDWARISGTMRAPVILDTRHTIDPDQIAQVRPASPEGTDRFGKSAA